MRRRTKLAIAVIGVLVATDQAILHLVLADGWLRGKRIAPFDPPLFAPSQFASLERLEAALDAREPDLGDFDFDPDLGWCFAPDGDDPDMRHGWGGQRVGAVEFPRERTDGVRRIGTFGCSFTLGTEVPTGGSWSSQLDAGSDDVEVANMGMAAYGLDQAFLRWRRDGEALDLDEVWLGWLPDAAFRNLTLYWPAGRHWTHGVPFKPRFQLAGESGLELVPSPASSPAELVRLLREPGAFHEAVVGRDYWVDRTPAAFAPRWSSIWHYSALGRMLLTYRESGGRAPADLLADESSESVQLIQRIAVQMASEVEASGQRFRLLVLPDQSGLRRRREDGRAYWDDVADRIRAAGVEVVDLSDALVAADAIDTQTCWAPGGHYSAEGNRVIAEALREVLARP